MTKILEKKLIFHHFAVNDTLALLVQVPSQKEGRAGGIYETLPSEEISTVKGFGRAIGKVSV